MNLDGPKDFFRLVLSYQEQAASELHNWERIRETQKLDRTNFDLVRAKYAAHERDARKLVKSQRTAADHALPGAETELRQRQRAQRKLVEAVAAGTIEPRKANDQNRRLTAEIEEWSARVDDLKAILAAETTEILGGRVVLPLEDYPKQIDLGRETKLPRQPLSPMERNIIAGLAMLALVLGTVFGIAALRSRVSADLSVSTRDIESGFLLVECRNTGNRAISLYVPWPNGQRRAPEGVSSPRRSYGLLLFVRQQGDARPRLLENAEGVWRYRGTTLEEGAPVEVAPNSAAVIYLELSRLVELGILPQEVAIELTHHGGGEIERKEIELANSL